MLTPRSIAGYRARLLVIITAIYATNFMDRLVLASMGTSIKRDLGLSDAQFGLAGGLGFTLLYILAGLPIARLADRWGRVKVIALATAIWSVMTMVCGAANSFIQLLLFRAGVAAGEAGLTPAAHSLISSEFPPSRRASAIGIFMLGIPIGAFVAAILGGWLAQTVGWRMGFLIVGLPGLVLAPVAFFGLKEPRSQQSASTPPVAFRTALAAFWARPAFRHLTIAYTLLSFGTFGVNLFLPMYFVRSHGLGMASAGAAFGLLTGVATLAGTVLGGFTGDRLAARDPRWPAWAPAIALVLATPLFMVALVLDNFAYVVGLTLMTSIFFYLAQPIINALIQNMARPDLRATASGLVVVISNLLGAGLGPPLIGWLSDRLAQAEAGRAGVACVRTSMEAACATAQASGLKWALIVGSLAYVGAAIHLFLAARSASDWSVEASQ